MAYLILISALSISLVSGYFSIIGLTTMFPAAFWSIVIMGGVLEVSKLVSTSWLHHNWKIAPRSLKIYLTTAVVVLIFITSMGIFGFLSKSHIEHQKNAEETAILMNQLEERIGREKDYIARQNQYISELSQDKDSSSKDNVYNIELEQREIDDLYSSLDKSISFDKEEIDRLNEKIDKLDLAVSDLEKSSGGLFSNKNKKIAALKEQQSEERSQINKKIEEAELRISRSRESIESQVNKIHSRIDDRQDDTVDKEDIATKKEEFNNNIKLAYEKINAMETEKFKYKNSQLQLEAEVGPVKYVAELLEDLGAQSIELAGG